MADPSTFVALNKVAVWRAVPDVPLASFNTEGAGTCRTLASRLRSPAAGRTSVLLPRVTVASIRERPLVTASGRVFGHDREWSPDGGSRIAALRGAARPTEAHASVAVQLKRDCDCGAACCGGPAQPFVPLVDLIPGNRPTHRADMARSHTTGMPPSGALSAILLEPLVDVSQFAAPRRAQEGMTLCDVFPDNPICEMPPPRRLAPPRACLQIAVGDPPRLPNDQPQIRLWPCGVIPYQFADTVGPSTRGYGGFLRNFIAAVSLWNDALEGWVVLTPQRPGDPIHHLLINIHATANNSRNGYADDRAALFQYLHLTVGNSPSNMAHELGHAIGLAHLQLRTDRAQWFRRQTAAQLLGNNCPLPVNSFVNPNTLQQMNTWTACPPLDSFDYAGISLNRVTFLSAGAAVNCSDLAGNSPVGNSIVSRTTVISAGDISRVHQYYHKQRHLGWSFFENIASSVLTWNCAPFPPPAALGPAGPSGLSPIPIGAPAVARARSFDAICARGLDDCLYFHALPRGSKWSSVAPLATGVRSDPTILVSPQGEVDAAFMSDGPPAVLHARRSAAGFWGPWRAIGDSLPAGGVTRTANGYTPPALIRNPSGGAAVIVSGADSNLYFSTMNGGRWSAWARVDLGGLIASTQFSASFSDGRILIAQYYPGVILVHEGASLARVRLVATHVGNISPGTRPIVVDMHGLGYRLFAFRETGPPGNRFSMLWAASGSHNWEPAGGLPKPGTSPGACSGSEPGGSGALLMVERDTVDDLGVFLLPGGLWRRDFE